MTIRMSIDERELQVEKGLTVLAAARQNGIYIPTLCDFPGLPSHGSCRMCIVEVQGRPNTPTACTTLVEEGMVIQTSSPRVRALREEILQMLLSEHPAACLYCPEKGNCDECMITLRKAAVTTGCGSCPKDDQCELQEMAERLNVSQPGYPMRYRMLPVEKYDPFFDRDYNLCVVCGRCIRACSELHFNGILAYTERGTYTVVDTAFHRTHLQAGCTFCGACVEVCPTGALTEKTRKWDGKPDGETPSTCPLCGIGCSINLLTKKNRVISSLPDHGAGASAGAVASVDAGAFADTGAEALCVKGRFGITELVNHPTRLKYPQKRVEHEWLEPGWEETLQVAAQRLTGCAPGQFEMRLSPSCSVETLYIAQKFTREVMRSERIYAPALARYGGGLQVVARLLEKSHPLEILQEAQMVLVLGLDAQYAQSVVEVALHRAKMRGAKILTINSRPHAFSGCADEWLRPAPGKETGLIQVLAGLAGSALPLDGLSGSEPAAIARAARLLREAGDLVIVVGPAFLAHPQNQSLLKAVEELADVTASRLIVLPEQGNLPGALRLGISASPWVVDQDTQILYLVGETVPELPDGDSPFVLYQNIYPPPDGARADLMLPAAAFTEEAGTLIDSGGRARLLRKAVNPPGAALPSWKILCQIAAQMGVPGFGYASVEEIRSEMAVIPEAVPDMIRVDSLPAVNAENLLPGQASEDHTYMGFHLSHWVEGLRMLYPEEAQGGAHVPAD